MGARVRQRAVLRRRGRAVHQRPRRGPWHLLRRAQPPARRATVRRAAPGRRMELRSRARLGALVLSHHAVRARGPAGSGEHVRYHLGPDGGANTGTRISDRTSSRWLLDVRHTDTLFEDIAGAVGAPNRWITLRALRVLDWLTHRTRSSRVPSFEPNPTTRGAAPTSAPPPCAPVLPPSARSAPVSSAPCPWRSIP